MRSQSERSLAATISVVLLVAIAAVAFLPSFGNAQKPVKKLTKQDVIDLLTGDVPSDQVAEEARKSGISFPVTSSVAKEIRDVGGTEQLIQVLQSLAPHASAPAVPPAPNPHPAAGNSPAGLLIESDPGQSQVYVDDEPKGSTSKQGRLKLTQLAPGPHTVRISLNGYQDYEKSVTLAGGELTTVIAALQQAEAAPVVTPPAPQTEVPPPASPGQVGYLGVLPMEQQPAGARGVVISGAAPGGPADQAGLKTYDAISAINGRTVSTAQELRSTLASYQAGEVVQITWYNGSNTVTKPIRLAAAPAQVQPPPQQQQQQQVSPPTFSNIPQTGMVSFAVAHDHGPNGQGGDNYCVGEMSIGNGMISYKGLKGTNGVHTYEIPLSNVKEARRNAVYLVAIGAFHVRLKKGTNYNFVVVNLQGQYQPPDPILTAIDNAMGK